MKYFKSYCGLNTGSYLDPKSLSKQASWEDFFSTSKDAFVCARERFPKSFLMQLFCREPVDASLYLKELYSRRYLKHFSEFLKYKAEDCSLYTWNFYYIFRTPVRNLVRSSCLVALESELCKFVSINM